MTPTEIAADVAARIKAADDEAHNATAAFAAGRFPEWWQKKAEEIRKRLEIEGEHTITGK